MSGGTRIPDSRNGNPGLNPGGSFRTGKSGQIQSPDGSAIQKSAKESGGKLATGAAGVGISQKAASIYQKSGPGVSQSSFQNPAFQKIPENSGSAEHTVPIREFFKQSAANLGFPKDILSVTLFAASRFFSLSPGAALLGELRRELLSSLKSSSPKNAAEKAALGAQSLAAAAARDKGVIPGPEALEHYARFFAFPVSDGEGGTGAEGGGNGGGENPSEQAAADAGPERRASSREDVPDAGELRAIADEEAGKDGLLNFFNTLPGKNGQRWIVYPFKINVRGIELSVIIRILKKVPLCSGSGKGPGKVPAGISEEDGRVIADIADPKRQWRFFLDKKAGKLRADIRVYPEMSSKALDSLKKEAESFFGKGRGAAFGGFEEIRAQNGGDKLSWAEDLCGEPLPSVNKEV